MRRFASFSAKAPAAGEAGLDAADLDAAVQTLIDALTIMFQHRADYPRFDESLRKQALKRVVIEPVVVNDEGKAFPFLVARTKEPGRVTLLTVRRRQGERLPPASGHVGAGTGERVSMGRQQGGYCRKQTSSL